MKLPDNENLTAVKEKILPVLKKYRAVLAVLLAGVLLLTSGHSGNTEQAQTASADTTVSQSFDLNDFQQELQARLAANFRRRTCGAHAVARPDRGIGLRGQHPPDKRE